MGQVFRHAEQYTNQLTPGTWIEIGCGRAGDDGSTRVLANWAKRAGKVFNDVNAHLVGITDKAERRKYIRSREKELRKEFTDPLTNLSIYQSHDQMQASELVWQGCNQSALTSVQNTNTS